MGTFQALGHGGPKYRHESPLIQSRKSQPDLHSHALRESVDTTEPSDGHSHGLGPREKSHVLGDESGSQKSPQLGQSPDITRLRQQRGSLSDQEGRNASISDQSAAGTPGTDEDEESDREQISSALYFPHRQVRPEVPSLTVSSRPSLLRARSVAAPTDEVPEVEEELLEQSNQNTNEVEISLESQDDNQLWHGDLQGSTAAEESPPDFSSTHDYNIASSVSEYDSHDDSAESTAYDSSTTDGTGGTAVASRHQPRRY